MRLFPAPLDICLDSPFFASLSVDGLAPHSLRAFELRRSVFTMPPHFYYALAPFSERKRGQQNEENDIRTSGVAIAILNFIRSPKAGHNKARQSDFRNQRFEADTGKVRQMQKVPLTQKNKGLRRFHCAKTSGESNRPLTPILLKSIAIHLPFLLRSQTEFFRWWSYTLSSSLRFERALCSS